MADLQELIKQLQSGSWSERWDAARRLALAAPEERDEAVRALQERLAVEGDGDVIGAIVGALLQLGASEQEVYDLLARRLSDKSWSVRRGVVWGLTELQDPQIRRAAIKTLKKRLAVEGNDNVIEAIVEALHDLGIGVEEMSRILSRNPNFSSPYWWYHVRWHCVGIFGQVIERLLHRRWWRLPAGVRKHFDSLLWHEPWRCPECRRIWDELLHLLERHGLGSREAERFIATWWGSPRWHFARSDFESLMSLRVEQSVIYEEQNILRFHFLNAFATDRQGRPIREWVREFQEDWDRILETEEAFDRLRDEISKLRRQLDEILAEAERRREGRPLEPGERLPEDLQGRWNEITGLLHRLEGDVEEPGELQRHRRPLEEATERLLPILRERGVRFQVIEVEGVLGEYNFFERKVTLYPPMIELTALDLASELGRPPEEVYDDLYTITEMHETAHATAHLGIDSDGLIWEHPQDGTSELHELLAQFYTIQLIRQLKMHDLEQVFLKLNEKQPERYRYWRVLEGVSLEKVRAFLTGQRTGLFRTEWLGKAKGESPFFALSTDATAIVSKAMPLIRSVLSETEFLNFAQRLDSALEEVEGAETRWELAEALENLLTVYESHPYILALLRMTLPFGWPTAEDRKLLLADLLVEGEPLQTPSLRLTMEQIRAARMAVLMQNDLVRRNTIIHQLRTAPELEKLACIKEQIESIVDAANVSGDKREKIVWVIFATQEAFAKMRENYGWATPQNAIVMQASDTKNIPITLLIPDCLVDKAADIIERGYEKKNGAQLSEETSDKLFSFLTKQIRSLLSEIRQKTKNVRSEITKAPQVVGYRVTKVTEVSPTGGFGFTVELEDREENCLGLRTVIGGETVSLTIDWKFLLRRLDYDVSIGDGGGIDNAKVSITVKRKGVVAKGKIRGVNQEREQNFSTTNWVPPAGIKTLPMAIGELEQLPIHILSTIYQISSLRLSTALLSLIFYYTVLPDLYWQIYQEAAQQIPELQGIDKDTFEEAVKESEREYPLPPI